MNQLQHQARRLGSPLGQTLTNTAAPWPRAQTRRPARIQSLRGALRKPKCPSWAMAERARRLSVGATPRPNPKAMRAHG